MDKLLIRKRQELRVINAEIAERETYRKEQKKLIDEMVEQGNTQLMELHHDILLAKKELRDLKTDIRTAAQDKVMLYQDLNEMRVEMHQLTIVHIPMANGFLGV